MKLILASRSTSRRKILDTIGLKYEIIISKTEENSNASTPEQYVIDLSKDKANSVSSQISEKALIISADSIIYMDGKKFEKPKSKEESFINIKSMSGKETFAVTGVTIKDLYQNKEVSFSDITKVKFKEITDGDIKCYIENDKDILFRAGYSVEGILSMFIDKIEGDYYNILGLPVSKLYTELNELGYTLSDFELNK